MPIYEYECGACGEDTEIIQKVSERPLRKCPSCGALKLRRKVSLSAFHLKGEGWYVTDYASSAKKNGAEKAEEASSKGDASQKKTDSSRTQTAIDAPKSEGRKSEGPKSEGRSKKTKSGSR